jgi:hypothetical protein
VASRFAIRHSTTCTAPFTGFSGSSAICAPRWKRQCRRLQGGTDDFWRKNMAKEDNPALCAVEFRDVVDRAIEQARRDHVPAFRVAEILDAAARTVRMRHAVTAPIL